MKNENGIEKSATLKGSTKYHDIDTGEFLETFEEGRNLELVSVKMPILTTSNEDGTKSNVLTVNEDVTLRAVDGVQDTLDLMTGEVTKRIGEIVLDGSEDEQWSADTPKDNINRYLLRVDNLKDVTKYSDSIKCDKWRVFKPVVGETENQEGIYINGWVDKIHMGVDVNRLSENSLNGFKQWLSQNPITVQYPLATESVKTVDLSIQDQDNQPQERMKLFPNGHINTSSSTFPPILELKGITHNNKLNMATTNGTNNTQLTTLDNLALDGIICRDGTVVRDSYDVESGLYTKRVFRFTIDEEFVERYRNKFILNGMKDVEFSMRIGGV